MKFQGDKLLIGSHNPNKIDEFNKYFTQLKTRILLISPKELEIKAPPETGNSFIENSCSKAIYYGKASGIITVSDDSGICVDALGGAPGIYTADWAFNGDYAPAIARLKNEITALGLKENDKYSASMVTVVSIYNPNEDKVQYFESVHKGYINFDNTHLKGIGFRSVYYPHPFDKPLTLLTNSEYNKISTRVNAFKKMWETCFKDNNF